MADDYATVKATEEASMGQAPLHSSREHMTVDRYLGTRFSTLKPPMNKSPNPFPIIALLNRRQWASFFIGFIAWVFLFRLTYICMVLTRLSPGTRLISSPLP